MYKWIYETPTRFSDILLLSDGNNLTGLYFLGSRDATKHQGDCEQKELPIFTETIKWLDIYFGGRVPDYLPKYRIDNLTSFRKDVIDIMLSIPYGETVTYGQIAKKIAEKNGIDKMSAQAVGGAVGWNPLCLLIPCHRVIGSDGSLTGYGGGMRNKIALLELEGHDMRNFIVPIGNNP